MESISFALAGGLLIGVATTLMLKGLGRITGISGIFSVLTSQPKREDLWKYNFLAGLIIGGVLMHSFFEQDFFNYTLNGSPLRVVLAGLLVGFGTRLGNGCTSGHGVCGVSRVAKRSIVATLTFIVAGMLVVTLEEVIL